MKTAIKLLTIIQIMFLLFSSLATSAGDVFYAPLMALFVFALAFLGHVFARRLRAEREEARGQLEERPNLLLISRDGVRLAIPTMAPTLAVIFLVSFLTSLLCGLFGIEGAVVEDASLLSMILKYALLPSIFEEIVFRYLPMELLAPYSKEWCITISSLYFAFAHADMTQIPYALLAGFVFIALNLMTESVWPSLILHFLNNVISVLWIKYSMDSTFVFWYVLSLAILALISLVPRLAMRKRYVARITELQSGGERLESCYAPVLFVGFCLALMLLNLFS